MENPLMSPEWNEFIQSYTGEDIIMVDLVYQFEYHLLFNFMKVMMNIIGFMQFWNDYCTKHKLKDSLRKISNLKRYILNFWENKDVVSILQTSEWFEEIKQFVLTSVMDWRGSYCVDNTRFVPDEQKRWKFLLEKIELELKILRQLEIDFGTAGENKKLAKELKTDMIGERTENPRKVIPTTFKVTLFLLMERTYFYRYDFYKRFLFNLLNLENHIKFVCLNEGWGCSAVLENFVVFKQKLWSTPNILIFPSILDTYLNEINSIFQSFEKLVPKKDFDKLKNIDDTSYIPLLSMRRGQKHEYDMSVEMNKQRELTMLLGTWEKTMDYDFILSQPLGVPRKGKPSLPARLVRKARHQMFLSCDYGKCEKEALYECGQCQKVAYCSVTCQKSDWDVKHKLVCTNEEDNDVNSSLE